MTLCALYWGRDPLAVLSPLALVLGCYIVMNWLTILANPDGLFLVYYADTVHGIPNWILGYKNPLIRIIIPALCVAYMRDILRSGRIRWWAYALTVVSVISVARVGSVNGVIALGAFLIMLLWASQHPFTRIVNIRLYLWVSLGFFVLIILLSAQEMFEALIVGVLGKDLTLVGRTYIWDLSLIHI